LLCRLLATVGCLAMLSCDMIAQQSRAATEKRDYDEMIAKLERERQANAEAGKAQLAESKNEHPQPRPNVDPVKDWLAAAPLQCVSTFNHSACFLPPDGATPEQEKQCADRCDAAIKETAKSVIEAAFKACTAETGEPSCSIEFPAGADPSGKGEAKFREGVDEARKECAKACAEQRVALAAEAKERTKAAQQGNDMVLAYKRCMLATDQTLVALTYRVHDKTLYQDLMQKTDSKCRVSNRCDWLEKHSDDFRCEYGD
jgi:hypothetical protein